MTALGVIITLAILAFLFYLVIVVRKKTITPSYEVKGKSATTYFIGFKDVEEPDIRKNSAIMDVLTVKMDTRDGYSVASTINDTKLRDLLMKEYNLKPKNVIVTYRQVL